MNRTALQSLMQAKVDRIRSELDTGIERMFPAVMQGFEPKTIPEPVFVQHFLPCFLGVNQNPGWAAEWVSVAGTPAAEVSVVDQTGRELYRVPPLMATQTLGFKDQQTSFRDIAETCKLQEGSLAGPHAYLADAMMSKISAMNNPEVAEVRTRWVEIGKRYGYTPSTVETATTPQKPSNPADDMFEY